jgi:hypothetical protein
MTLSRYNSVGLKDILNKLEINYNKYTSYSQSSPNNRHATPSLSLEPSRRGAAGRGPSPTSSGHASNGRFATRLSLNELLTTARLLAGLTWNT